MKYQAYKLVKYENIMTTNAIFLYSNEIFIINIKLEN